MKTGTDNEIISDFTEKYGPEKAETIQYVLDMFASDEFHDFEKDGLIVSCTSEKIHQLQENVCVSVSDEDGNVLIELLYESGINNGTQLNDYKIDPELSFTQETREHEILKDIVLDIDRMTAMGVSFNINKANALFANVKEEILKLIKDQNYDNYFTGGGTIKTRKHYKDRFEKFNAMGLYWKGVYESIEIPANFN